MCATCGCEGDAKTTMLNLQTGAETAISGGHDPHEHVHADGTRHSHVHDHADAHSHENETRHHGHDHSDDGHHHDHAEPHVHDHAHAPAGEVHSIERRILAKNDALATKIRAWLAGRKSAMAPLRNGLSDSSWSFDSAGSVGALHRLL